MFLLSFFQCDTSALGGSPSSTLTCSTASPCSESPSSTLNTSAGSQPLLQPLSLPSPHCSPSGTLSSTVPSPAACLAPGPITRSSPGPPSQSPTSTLESKDSGIIGECWRCVSVGNPAGLPGDVYPWVLIGFRTQWSITSTKTLQKSHVPLKVK